MDMRRIYRVFVSSTQEDLRDEREAVMRTLLDCSCIPTAMEMFAASDDEVWSYIKRAIDPCDFHVTIVGGRYGTLIKSGEYEGKSYSEAEYDYAKAKGKYVMGFVQGNPLLAKESPEVQAQLAQFREKVRGQVAPPFSTQIELCLQVMKAINNEAIPSGRGIGYVRADSLDSFRPLEEVRRIEEGNRELEAEVTSLRLRPPETANGLAGGGATPTTPTS